MKSQFPTVQEQINYWNEIERLEHERVMNIRAESPNERTETGDDNRIYPISEKDYAMFQRWVKDAASNPQEQASTTALTLDQTEATCDWFDSLADQEEARWSLRKAGSNDGEGESYSARNV